MSDVAIIGWFDAEVLKCVRCYDNSTVDKLGALLQYKYNGEKRIKSLIDKGDIYILGESMTYKRGMKKGNAYFYPNTVYLYQNRPEYIVDNIVESSTQKITPDERKELMHKYMINKEDTVPKIFSISNNKFNAVLHRYMNKNMANSAYLYNVIDKEWYLCRIWGKKGSEFEIKKVALRKIFGTMYILEDYCYENNIPFLANLFNTK